MSNINCPPPSYEAAIGAQQEAPPPQSQQPVQTQYNNNTVYTVPLYPQPHPAYNQYYYPPVVIQQTDFEIQQKRRKKRKCMCAALSVAFCIVLFFKFVLIAFMRS